MYKKREQFYSMFFSGKGLSLLDYLYNASCDEIMEFDILNDSIKQMFHTNGKYLIPKITDKFSVLYSFVAQDIIHLDDIEIYKDLMNPETILEKLDKSPFHNFRFAHFRYRIQSGGYRWVEQCIITGEENGISKGKVLMFVFDFENQMKLQRGENISDEMGLISAKRDGITHLYKSETFFSLCETKIENEPNVKWCLFALDIEHFKLFDEWYGRNMGDILLAKIGVVLSNYEKSLNALGGYLGQDDFVFLLPFDMNNISQIYEDVRSAVISFGFSVGFMPAIGVSFVDNEITVKEAFDRASIASARAKKDIKNRIYVYDAKMRINTEKEYRILSDFIHALKNDEITFYLQPQVRISNRKIVGAEALARWIKPDGTIIWPNDFIPILEKYGFITDLDQIMWENVFKWLRSWIDRGHKPVPISVNVSRTDIFTIDIASFFKELARKYKIPHNLIKIEITESAYAEITETIVELVRKLRSMGFAVLMDDFGSGYSSLNMLRNLNIDAIKLDGYFLNMNSGDSEFEKGVHILESVVNMTKQISTPIIVEGVENEKQVKFLEELGCRYAQGFFFYKGIPVSDFENVIADGSMIDDRGLQFKANEQLTIREFLDGNIYSDTMLNNVLGPVAFYDWDGAENVDIVRYNEQFYKAVGVSDFNEKIASIQKVMPPEDQPVLFSKLQEAFDNRLNGSSAALRFYKIDGTTSSFYIRFYFIGETDGKKRYYGAAADISSIIDLRQEIELITKYSKDNLIFVKRVNEKWIYKVVSHGLSDVVGLTPKELEDQMNNGQFAKRVLNQEEFGKFMKNVVLYSKANKDFKFVAQINDVNGELINVELDFHCVKKLTDNIRYVINTSIIK